MMAPVPFALVCFRANPNGTADVDALNERLMNAVNATGEAYLSHTKLNGSFTLRLSVGSLRVEESHISKVWELLNAKLTEEM
jgi:aromatic-L-amino-acid decarboxylase